MANRVPDPREMLKMAREVRRTTTRYDIATVCNELERRLLLDLRVDPPDGVPVAVAPVQTPPASPDTWETGEDQKAARKALGKPGSESNNESNRRSSESNRESNTFDRKAWQREYMRKRRAEAKAAKGKG